MRHKLYLLGFFVFVLSSNVWAGKVDLHAAETVALNFYKLNTQDNRNGNLPTALLKYTRREIDNSIDFYVFEIAPKGFVIVTADDNLEPVIGYSTESDFRTDFEKTGVKDWMDNTARKIANARNQNAIA